MCNFIDFVFFLHIKSHLFLKKGEGQEYPPKFSQFSPPDAMLTQTVNFVNLSLMTLFSWYSSPKFSTHSNTLVLHKLDVIYGYFNTSLSWNDIFLYSIHVFYVSCQMWWCSVNLAKTKMASNPLSIFKLQLNMWRNRLSNT